MRNPLLVSSKRRNEKTTIYSVSSNSLKRMFDVVEHDFCKRRRIQLSFEVKKTWNCLSFFLKHRRSNSEKYWYFDRFQDHSVKENSRFNKYFLQIDVERINVAQTTWSQNNNKRKSEAWTQFSEENEFSKTWLCEEIFRKQFEKEIYNPHSCILFFVDIVN